MLPLKGFSWWLTPESRKVSVSWPLGCGRVSEAPSCGWAFHLQFWIAMASLLKTETLIIISLSVMQFASSFRESKEETVVFFYHCFSSTRCVEAEPAVESRLRLTGRWSEPHTKRPWQLRIEPTALMWTQLLLVIPLPSHANSQFPGDRRQGSCSLNDVWKSKAVNTESARL